LKDVQVPTEKRVNFAMNDECEKLRMKEAANELASLISSLRLESEEMLIKEHVELTREKIVDAVYNMVKLTKKLWK
jgi:hypothetical protein